MIVEGLVGGKQGKKLKTIVPQTELNMVSSRERLTTTHIAYCKNHRGSEKGIRPGGSHISLFNSQYNPQQKDGNQTINIPVAASY